MTARMAYCDVRLIMRHMLCTTKLLGHGVITPTHNEQDRTDMDATVEERQGQRSGLPGAVASRPWLHVRPDAA